MKVQMEPFRSARYILTISVKGSKHKVCQIIFSKRDGSIFINLPYYRHSEGIVSLVTYPGNVGPQLGSLSLETGGKVTSHLVKYSHHPDGKVHFSQDGKVRTVISKQSVPFTKLHGHMFTMTIQGVRDYKITEFHNPLPTDKKTVLSFDFKGVEPKSIKIVGRWYKAQDISWEVNDEAATKTWSYRWWPVQIKDGRTIGAFPLSPPVGNPYEEYVLLLTCEKVPTIDKENSSCLLFIGGFDPVELVNDLTQETTFLALSYPASNYRELMTKLGSIDYIREIP